MPTAEQFTVYRKCLEQFVSLTNEEWNILREHLYIRKLKKRDLFVKESKVCNEIAFIFSGSFRFFYIKEGVEISSYFCFESDLISSYKSFLKKEPSSISIEAIEDAELICFSHISLQQLLQDQRIAYKMERFGRLVAEYLVCCYEERVISFVTQSPEERYLQLLEKQPDLMQRIPQYYLANFLGITPVSLSRIRRRLSPQISKRLNSKTFKQLI